LPELCEFFIDNFISSRCSIAWVSQVRYPIICDYAILPSEYKLKIADKLEMSAKKINHKETVKNLLAHANDLRKETFTEQQKSIYQSMFIKYNDLVIKNDEYLWENNMHAFTELSLEIESRGFYNSPEWFEKLRDGDFLKVIKYFKLFSANTPESNKYFNEIRADTLIFDFCKDAIKMFKECNSEYYILCCNFIKAIALCSNNFYNNLPVWLLANGTGAGGVSGQMGIGSIIDNIRINTNLETLIGAMNRNNASELANNFLLYYYVEHI
jgi:hypothetical protein